MIRYDRWPALSEHRALRFSTFALLYAAQGIPYGLLNVALPAWLAQRGLSAGKIGLLVGIVLLPWSFKLLAGPILDRWTYLPMGRRRPWILAGQAGLLASLAGLLFVPDPMTNLTPLLVVGFLMNSFAALQDVATDGMAIEVLPGDEQARANGLMWGSKMVGVALTGAATAWLLTHAGWAWAVLACAGGVGLACCAPLLLRERRGERLLPWTQGTASASARALQADNLFGIGRDVWRASALPMSLLMGAAAFVYNVATGLFDAAIPVFCSGELGWKVTEFSNLKGLGSMVGGIFGMVIGGYLVDRFGRLRVMRLLLGLYTVLHGVMALGGAGVTSRTWLGTYVVLNELLYTLVTIAIFAVAMQLCWKRVAATQFTVYMTVSNLGSSAGAVLLGPLTAQGGFPLVWAAIAGSAMLALALIRTADLARHGVGLVALEREASLARAAI